MMLPGPGAISLTLIILPPPISVGGVFSLKRILDFFSCPFPQKHIVDTLLPIHRLSVIGWFRDSERDFVT
jgi:hypothetical protein